MANPYHDAKGEFTTAQGDSAAARERKIGGRSPEISHIGITVQPGQDFRGAHHYQPVKYDASTHLAVHAVKTGAAKFTSQRDAKLAKIATNPDNRVRSGDAKGLRTLLRSSRSGR